MTQRPQTIDEYIDALAEPRRADLRALHELIRARRPDLAPTMEFGMPGYGKYHYRYASGREGDHVLISLASNKSYISLYVMSILDGQYLAERYRDALPRASIGKSCIRPSPRHGSDHAAKSGTWGRKSGVAVSRLAR